MAIKDKIAKWIGYGNALKIKYFFQKPRPKEIIIDICAACNASCPFCPRIYMPEERSKGYMDIELFKFILEEAKQEKIKKIRLYSTAEPTLHPRFDEIIELLVEGGFHIFVSTNGSRIKKHAEALMKVDVLQFSIEGWDKESYEKYRYPLKFEQVYDGIKYFHEKRKEAVTSPRIITNLLLTRHTDLQKYMDLWGEYIDEFKAHFMLEATLYEEGKFVSKKNEKILDEYYDFYPQKENFVCGYPFNVLTIAFDGKIALCCNDFSASMDIGNIKDGIKSVFQLPVLESIRQEFYSQDLVKCKGCAIFKSPSENDRESLQKAIGLVKQKEKIEVMF